jgi:hypothetical protein
MFDFMFSVLLLRPCFIEVTMLFLWKQPCTVSRVLSIADIPPHDVLHSPCEYAYYYDTLYYLNATLLFLKPSPVYVHGCKQVLRIIDEIARPALN